MRLMGFVLLCGLSLTANAYRAGEPGGFSQQLSDAALEQTRHEVQYDSQYRVIPYPMGDVPAHLGVCTDVVVRAYRQQGIDLQEEVHRDMRAHFKLYPKRWGLKSTDTNIDHRRVPNLEVFFKRQGIALPITDNPQDYVPGDLVTWTLPGNLPHIGIVVAPKTPDGQRHLIVHNIGWGPKLEDVLFAYPINGHFRYYGRHADRARQ